MFFFSAIIPLFTKPLERTVRVIECSDTKAAIGRTRGNYEQLAVMIDVATANQGDLIVHGQTRFGKACSNGVRGTVVEIPASLSQVDDGIAVEYGEGFADMPEQFYERVDVERSLRFGQHVYGDVV